MTQYCRRVLVFWALALACGAASAHQRPLLTEDPRIAKSGEVQLEFGMGFFRNQEYKLYGIKGNLYNIGAFGVHVGLGGVAEFELDGVLQNVMRVQARGAKPWPQPLGFSGNSTHNVGDFTVAGKVHFIRQGKILPDIGARAGVKLPNASNESGLGTDMTDAVGQVMLGRTFGRVRVNANIGFTIYGEPLDLAGQDDFMTGGISLDANFVKQWHLLWEFTGQTGPETDAHRDERQTRVGLAWDKGHWRADLGFSAGIAPASAGWGVVAGMTYRFKAFKWGDRK